MSIIKGIKTFFDHVQHPIEKPLKKGDAQIISTPKWLDGFMDINGSNGTWCVDESISNKYDKNFSYMMTKDGNKIFTTRIYKGVSK